MKVSSVFVLFTLFAYKIISDMRRWVIFTVSFSVPSCEAPTHFGPLDHAPFNLWTNPPFNLSTATNPFADMLCVLFCNLRTLGDGQSPKAKWS